MSATRRSPMWLVIAAASLPMFMATLDNLVVTNALPVLAKDLGASIEQLQWFINAYALSFASLILMAVALGDRFGRRRVFVAGIMIFTVASALCALATTPEQLIAARVLQGAGGAAVMPLSLAILAGSVAEKLRPLAIGIWGGVAGLGVALGPLIGGAVVEGISWHAIFWLNVPVGVLAVPLIFVALREARGDRVPLDLVGLALGVGAVFGIVFGIVRGNDAGWTSRSGARRSRGRRRAPRRVPRVGGASPRAAAAAGACSGTGHSPSPTLSRSPSASASLARSSSSSSSCRWSRARLPLEAGVLTMPWTMAPLVVAPIAGMIAPRFGTRALLMTGMASMTWAWHGSPW